MTQLIAELVDSTDFEPPFVLFGHSLGALVAFETARVLTAGGSARPQALILSALGAPHLGYRTRGWHRLSDEALAATLSLEPGLLPPAITADPGMLELLLPAFRADTEILETYTYRDENPLPFPFHIFAGDRDRVSWNSLEAWKIHTSNYTRMHRLPGGHFPFREDYSTFQGVLRTVLAQCMVGVSPNTP